MLFRSKMDYYDGKLNHLWVDLFILDKQIGRPDLLVLFTNTVSHKMIRCALDEVNENETEIVRCHTSSGTALTEILMQHVPA